MLVRLELSSVRIFCTQFAVLYRWIIYQCGEYSLFCVLDLSFDLILEQESIPVGCEPPARQPYVLHNKQVRSKCLRGMGSGWRRGEGENPCTLMSHVLGVGSGWSRGPCTVRSISEGPCMVRSNVSWNLPL